MRRPPPSRRAPSRGPDEPGSPPGGPGQPPGPPGTGPARVAVTVGAALVTALAVACAAEAPGRREAAVVEAPVDAIPGAIDTYRVGAIEITVLQRASDYAPHPSVSIAVPEGYRLLGGGASVEWSGAGNLLTSAWPDLGGRAWVASSKDHERGSPARIVAQAIVARMADGSPIRADDYLIVSNESARAQHPETTATLPKGFRLVGGGARVN
jgi:hypothetical protein